MNEDYPTYDITASCSDHAEFRDMSISYIFPGQLSINGDIKYYEPDKEYVVHCEGVNGAWGYKSCNEAMGKLRALAIIVKDEHDRAFFTNGSLKRIKLICDRRKENGRPKKSSKANHPWALH